jgi:hypothetical protein
MKLDQRLELAATLIVEMAKYSEKPQEDIKQYLYGLIAETASTMRRVRDYEGKGTTI